MRRPAFPFCHPLIRPIDDSRILIPGPGPLYRVQSIGAIIDGPSNYIPDVFIPLRGERWCAKSTEMKSSCSRKCNKDHSAAIVIQ